jgi:polyhydroxyalkanoate synthesis regulator phasin
MAQAKTQKNRQKKRTAKTRFYVVSTVERTRRQLSGKLDDYSDTYISGPIKSGRERITDLRQAPRKTLSGWLDEGKEMISDLNQETRSTVDKMVKEGKAFLTRAGNAPRQTFDEMVDDGKAWVEDLREDARSRMADLQAETRSLLKGIGKDAQLVADEVVAGGRQALDKVPGKQKIEKAVRLRMRTLPAQLNLPSKRDIDGLARRVSTLNKKVDALQRAVSNVAA